MSLLEVDGLSVRYDGAKVVDQLSFSLAPGASLGLVGESGSGKTQTALALLGLLPPSAWIQGSIKLGAERILDNGSFAPTPALNRIRSRRIGMVFQDPSLALNPYVRIGRQLEHIVTTHGVADAKSAPSRVVEALGRVGLPNPERQAKAYPHQLSGGMRQRAMIAAALIAGPELLVADEPTTALDVTVQAQILEMLEEIREKTALLLITHDLGVVAGYCENLIVLDKGRKIDEGPTRQVFASPKEAHTRALLAAHPRLDATPPSPPAGSSALLAINNLQVSYREPGHGQLHAVNGVDLEVKEGETVAIVGESGSGKSTLVRAALGLVPPGSGEVVYLGTRLPGSVRRRGRQTLRELQLVFQDPVGSLNPQHTVARIVSEPLSEHSPGKAQVEIGDQVAEALYRVGLDPSLLRRYPHELSGGQAQRVAIARALITEPRVLVCDEAVAALDGTVRRQVLELLRDEQQRTGLAILFISHDLAVVRSIAHRVMVMYLGRSVEIAANSTLFREPRHPYTEALIAAIPTIDVDKKREKSSISGESASILSPPSGCAFHPRCKYAVAECRSTMPRLEMVGQSEVACLRAYERHLTSQQAGLE
jgi:peptide/nickel transport system ATP-binding protein